MSPLEVASLIVIIYIYNSISYHIIWLYGVLRATVCKIIDLQIKGQKGHRNQFWTNFFRRLKKRSKKDPGTNSGPFFNILSKVEKKGQKKIQKRFGEAQSVRLLRDAWWCSQTTGREDNLINGTSCCYKSSVLTFSKSSTNTKKLLACVSESSWRAWPMWLFLACVSVLFV